MRTGATALALALTLAAVLFARPHPTPGPPMRDFEAYYAAGAAANRRVDPYSAQLWKFEKPLDPQGGTRRALLPFVSPPATLAFFRALARLDFETANALWRALLILCIACIVTGALRIARIAVSPQTLAAGACAAVGFGPLTGALALGQLALPAFALTVASLFAPPLALAAFMQPNIAVVLASQYRRTLIAAAALCGAVLALAPGGAAYAALVSAHHSAEAFSAIQLTPAAILFGFGVAARPAAAIGIAVAALALAAAAYAIVRARDGFVRFAIACAAVPFIVPFFHEHDAIVAFVPSVLCASRSSKRAETFAFIAAAFAAVDWLGLAQRPDGALQTSLLCSAFVLALFALKRDAGVRAAAIAMLITLGAVALAASAAIHHPLGVWPDAMQPFALAANASAAQEWHAEQAAAGLFQVQPLWSVLRLCTLAGCAALAAMLAWLNVDVLDGIERRDAVRMEVA